MLRIAFVTPEYIVDKFNGGLANYIYRITQALNALGHQPLVITPSRQTETFIHAGVEVHHVKVGSNVWLSRLNYATHWRLKWMFNLLWRSWELNRTLKYIHTQQSVAAVQYANLGGVGAFRLNSVPSVVRVSSYTPLWIAKGGYNGAKLKAVRQQALVEWWSMKRADAIFGPSRVVASVVGKATNRSVQVIESPFVLDCTHTDDSIYNTSLLGKDYLLFFGTLNVLKGVETIADTVYTLLNKHRSLRFVFIGRENTSSTGEPLMVYVRRQAHEYADRVIYLGDLPHKQLYPILSHALAVVLPSRIDNLPNTCLEAMAHERVVVGTRGASFEQLIIDGESGFLCEIDNPSSLQAALEKAIQLADEQRKEMGMKAKQRIAQLTPERVGQQLVDFYRRVIAYTSTC